jgi:hypothetical protein
MNLVHKMNGENLTFEEFSDQLRATVLQHAASGDSYLIAVILDVYKCNIAKYYDWIMTIIQWVIMISFITYVIRHYYISNIVQ